MSTSAPDRLPARPGPAVVPGQGEAAHAGKAAGYGAEHAMQDVVRAIQGGQRFLVSSHLRPDGDAVGASLACAEMLRALGKDVDVVLAHPVPQVYLTLPGVQSIQHRAEIWPERYDTGIVLECDCIERTGLSGLQQLSLINIDHHITGRGYGSINWIDQSAAAVALMVYRLACALGVTVTPSMATNLYTGVFTDTGAFTFPGTAHSALPLAQDLIACGADADGVARDVLYSVSTAHIRLLGTALSRMELSGSTAWSYITQEDFGRFGATDEDSEGTVDYLIGIAGVDAAFFLRELPQGTDPAQSFRVSLRSKTNLDVSTVATAHGGGGHKRAAGCTVRGPLLAAVDSILRHVARSRMDIRQ